jgi:hypothetical protein
MRFLLQMPKLREQQINRYKLVKVQQVHRDHKDQKVTKAILVHRDHRGPKDPQVHKVLLGWLDQLAHKDKLGLMVQQDRKARPVTDRLL